MKRLYYDFAGHHVAVIGKAGSSAIGKAIMLTLRPHYQIVSVSGNQEVVDKINNGPGVWQSTPKTDTPTSPIIPVRDPVERFRSACAQDSVTDVDTLLDKLEAGERPTGTFHYRPTSDWLVEDSRLYKFPEHVTDIAAALGLASIPQVNDSASNNIPKPDLTTEQLARVQAIYADDIALYESITEAGQAYTSPAHGPTTEEIEAATINAAHDAAAAAFESMPKGKQALWEPVRLAVQRAIKTGDFTTAREIIETVPNLYTGMSTDRDNFLALFGE